MGIPLSNSGRLLIFFSLWLGMNNAQANVLGMNFVEDVYYAMEDRYKLIDGSDRSFAFIL